MKTASVIKFVLIGFITVGFCADEVRLLADDGLQTGQESSLDSVSFESDIRPLLQSRCFHCHGEKTRKANLNLETSAGISQGGESGSLIVPKEPGRSLLFEKIHAGEMPPDGKDRLSHADVKRIERWIRNGATLNDSRWSNAAARSLSRSQCQAD